MVQAASSSKDEERPIYKWYRGATLITYHRLLSMVPYSPYVNSIEDNVIVTTSSKGIEISSSLGSKGEVNSNREE